MKKIKHEEVDDSSLLDLLEEKYSNITSQTTKIIRQQYSSFSANGGDPWKVSSVNLSSVEKNELVSAYKNRSQPFSYIKKIRDSSPNICPMCGSPSTGTIDHYLPKNYYPEFSVFSQNLIPACKCNFIKNQKYIGDTQPERFINPLTDNFVEQRLYKIQFFGDFNEPQMEITLCDPAHPNKEILEFHKDNLLDKEHFRLWLFNEWASLIKMPRARLSMLFEPNEPVEILDFIDGIKRYESSTTSSYGTPNNWLSILLYGILENQALLKWLNDCYNNLSD